jgi:drug/metabolite transporter (DMT)-like permease
MLILIIYFKNKKLYFNPKKNWLSSFMLFLYAISFSYAYISLDAGIGALILFAMVQITLIAFALIYKENLNFKKIIGLVISLVGLIYLLYPKNSFELSLPHSLLMLLAGVAWGIYTILGKNSTNATLHTADNFTKALVYVFIFYILFVHNIQINEHGVILAIISGAITSALGYSLWYYLLPKISILTSGSLQLIVPPISIFLSVILLGEPLSLTLILSTVVILGGILITIIPSRSK